MLKRNKKRGFTLVEIVVVIAILAVLAGVLAPALISHVELSRMQKDESAMSEVVNAVHLALSDAEVFDEAYSYCVKNNYLTYSDSSGKYGQTISDEEFWAPDGSGAAVTITFNPDGNGNYDISKGLINDMTYGNGSVAEKRTSEDAQQCYLYEMGNQALYKAIEQSIGSTINESSATYRNSSYTVFIKFNIVDGTRKADVYGQYNGTNLSEGCPAAIGTQTSSYENEQPVIKKTGGIQTAVYSSSDLAGSGTLGSFTLKKPLATYKQCKDGHTFDVTNPVLAERCICTVCFVTEHKFHETGTILKCQRCGYAKEHECKGNPCPLCGAIPFTVTAGNRDKVGFMGEENEKLVIPKTFVDTDGKRYRVVGIGTNAFDGCSSLSSINIPDGVTSIGYSAFQGCSSLTSINTPDGVTSIGYSAFHECSSLTNITIPNSVTSIGDYAFYNCGSLTSITIPDSVTSIGTKTFYCCTSLNSVTIPDGVKSIGGWAFFNCTSLTDINIPDGVTSIGDSAFLYCHSLTSINIPDSVTSIENYAFRACGSLTSINIPDSVTSIGDWTFYCCGSLTSVTYKGTQAQWNAITKGTDWKYNVPKSCIIHCIDGCVNLSGTQITCPTHGTAGTQG